MKQIPTPPGQLVDVGGYRLHLQRAGQGWPVAVMDSGLAGNSLLWANALAEVSRFTEACAFDRAGYAWSEASPDGVARTSLQIVAELRLLLERAGLPPPYILLGHSFGAINMLVYAYQYPAEVAGLVLVDPSHPEMFTRIPQVPKPEVVRRSFQVLSGLGRLGLLRLLGPRLARMLLPEGQQSLPPEAWEALVYFASGPRDYETAARETKMGWENFAQARGEPVSLGALPLEILTADWWTKGKQTPLKTASLPLRDEMARLSSRGRHLIVENCDHSNLPVVRPDAVATSVQRILETVTQIQTGKG